MEVGLVLHLELPSYLSLKWLTLLLLYALEQKLMLRYQFYTNNFVCKISLLDSLCRFRRNQRNRELAVEQFWRTWSRPDLKWLNLISKTLNMWAILINILTNTRNFAWTFCKICFPNRKNIPKRILVNKTEYWTFQIGCQKIRKDDISLTIHVWLECKIVHRGVHHYICSWI